MSSCAECRRPQMAAPVICLKCLDELRGRAEELERLKKTKDMMTEEDIKAISLGAAALLFHPELSPNAAQGYAGRLYKLQDVLSGKLILETGKMQNERQQPT